MTENTKPRWESYADEVIGQDSPELAAAVEQYAKNRWEGKSSTETEETLARLKEENSASVDEFKFVKESEYADIGPRMGRILSYADFINILRDKCHLKCFYREMSKNQKLALWVHKDYMTTPELACWVQRPYMIEFEVMRFDDKGVPLDSKYRGWRTCLLQMRMKGMLTEEQINKAFGRACGPASARYNAMLQELRKNS